MAAGAAMVVTACALMQMQTNISADVAPVDPSRHTPSKPHLVLMVLDDLGWSDAVAELEPPTRWRECLFFG